MRVCSTCNQRFSGDATFCPFDGTKLEGQPATQMALQRQSEEYGVGTVLGGQYRIDKVLGEGGMGIVFAVTHTKLNKRFALKLLRRDLARDPETRARFLLEAQAAGQIRHPNVVEITDFTSLPDGGAYLVMEFLEGQPLSRMIKLGGAIPALRALKIIRDVASALEAAHEAGVVHRDLKPDNVFVIQVKEGVGTREAAKILDFGVAKVAGSAKLTRAGMVFGTPHYMSPEQASGGAVDARTDIYALGVIMYEMFTGRVPFEADTYMGVLTKHMFESPRPPSQLAGPARELGALEDVTLKALAKRPEERYASMAELLIDLDRIVKVGADGSATIAETLDGLARPPPVARISSASLADELEPPARAELVAAEANVRERRVRRVGLFAVFAVLLLGAGIGTAALVARLGAPPQTDERTKARAAQGSPSTGKPASGEAPAGTKAPTESASAQASTPAFTPAFTPTGLAASNVGSTPSSPTAVAPTSLGTYKPPPAKPPPAGGSDIEDPWAKKK